MIKRLLSSIIIVACLIVIGISGWNIYGILSNYNEGKSKYEQIRESIKSVKEVVQSSVTKTDYCYPEEFLVNGYPLNSIIAKQYELDFPTLLSYNSEVKGWISIEETNIDYPIVQGDTNDEYLRHTIEHTFNNAGSIFLDYQVRKPFEEFNTIIYGHNQRNGMMFHDLVKYQEQEFYQKHPYIQIDTPEKTYIYQICSAYITNASSDTYLLESYRSFQPQIFLNQMKNAALYDTGAVMNLNDQYLTLSTCTNDEEEERMVVQAKKIGVKANKTETQKKKQANQEQQTISVEDERLDQAYKEGKTILDSKYQPCQMDWKNLYIILAHVTSYGQQKTIAVYSFYQLEDQDYPILITGAKDPASNYGTYQIYNYAEGYVFQLCDALQGTITYCKKYGMFRVEETGQVFQLVRYNLLETEAPKDAVFENIVYHAVIDNELSEESLETFVIDSR